MIPHGHSSTIQLTRTSSAFGLQHSQQAEPKSPVPSTTAPLILKSPLAIFAPQSAADIDPNRRPQCDLKQVIELEKASGQIRISLMANPSSCFLTLQPCYTDIVHVVSQVHPISTISSDGYCCVPCSLVFASPMVPVGVDLDKS